jgi:hypothetical protein
MNASYQVQVQDGSGAIVALANQVNPQTKERGVKDGIFGMSCEWRYAVDALPAAPVYTFVLMETSGSTQEDTKTISASEVANGKLPYLNTSFCTC